MDVEPKSERGDACPTIVMSQAEIDAAIAAHNEPEFHDRDTLPAPEPSVDE